MRNVRRALLPTCLLISTMALGQGIHPDARPGSYTDGTGTRFFQILGGAVQSQDHPMTFDEAVEASSVIARGNFSGVILGRSQNSARTPEAAAINTVFLKIVPSNVLKGNREDYYLVETPGSVKMSRELNETLYLGELVFFLSPAENYFMYPAISVWPEGQAELANDRPLYMLTRQSLLFALSGSGRLASPLHPWPQFVDLYTNIGSLEEFESRIMETIEAQTQR